MLSDREVGFKIAVNILNVGRIKLGIAAIGASKMIANKSTEYANERKQFGTAISNFGAIKQSHMQSQLLGVHCSSCRGLLTLEALQARSHFFKAPFEVVTLQTERNCQNVARKKRNTRSNL